MKLDDSTIVSLINQSLLKFKRIKPEYEFFNRVENDTFCVISANDFLTKYWDVNSEIIAKSPDIIGFLDAFPNAIVGITRYFYACVGDVRERQYLLLKDPVFRNKVSECLVDEFKLFRLIRLYDGANYYSYYGHINFAIHSLVTFILSKWQEISYIVDVGSMLGNLPDTIILVMRSILSVVEKGDLPSGYSLLRTLIERFFAYDVLDNSPQNILLFKKFQAYREEYYASGDSRESRKPSKEVRQNYTERQYKQDSFYDLGYLDEIDHNPNRKGKYTFSRLLKCSKRLSGNKDDIEKWFQSYARCNYYVHGGYTIKDTYQYDYIWILARVGELLLYLVSDLKQVIGMTFDQSGIDLENYLKQAVEGANKLYQMSLDADKENKEKGLQNPPL